MNPKQAIALAIGLIAALGIVSYHWPQPPPRRVSSQTQAGGGIVTTYESRKSVWPPIAYAVVFVATGLTFYGLRRRA